MIAAPLPRDEVQRHGMLVALNVLDTLPEAFSDAISTAAAAIADVPISAISLVDTERQWFKGSCGLGIRETSRDISFCAHAILSNEPFLVPDASQDPRFRDNPLVTGPPFIHAYAGFPILIAGQAVGALCVIDDRPRSFTSEQIDRLSRLAAGTAAWLTERQSLSLKLDRTQAELRYVTLTDSVTGLPNRLMLQDRLKQVAARRGRSCKSIAVVFIDIDGFKRFNDGSGDEAESVVLREIAQRLSALCRQGDTVARIGRDQFVLMTESSEVDWLAFLALRIATELAKPIGPSGLSGTTASIGVSCHPVDGSHERLIINADKAMIAAKRSGGNCCRFFEPRMDVDARTRTALLTGLRVAVQRQELELHYQPKILSATGQIAGLEALLRWRHPERGLISPVVFIPLAESAGLINELGSWVIEETCRQMAAWRRLGFYVPVAVNLSVHQLREPGLAEQISGQLRRHQISPELLTCEITESMAMDDGGTALEVFHRLKAIGIQLSIDDFGTGYSSLSYLRKLPVHQLKIDRSFVADVGTSDDARAIVTAIINLAHALRLEVVAEGVETVIQRDILVKLACDKLQGFLFAKPLSASDLFAWAANADGQVRSTAALVTSAGLPLATHGFANTSSVLSG